MRSELNLPEVPLIIGDPGEFWGKSNLNFDCIEYNLVNGELLKFVNEQKHCYFITAKGLISNLNEIHKEKLVYAIMRHFLKKGIY